MKHEIEFYLLRLYIRRGGWRITLFEIQNFDSGANWALVALGWDKSDGAELSFGAQ